MDIRPQTFTEFWPFYVDQHRNDANRWLHVAGTLLAVGFVLGAAGSGQFVLMPLGLVLGYGPAWVGHFFIERNRPATFTYPLWSFMGDFVMAWHTIRGTWRAELERLGRMPSLENSP